jgi:hypothetical protein
MTLIKAHNSRVKNQKRGSAAPLSFILPGAAGERSI